MMTIHPLLLVIGPAITIAYALIWEEKRVKAQYGLKDVKVLKSSDPMFSTPRKVPNPVEVEKLVEEYKKLLKSRAKRKKKEEED